MDLEGLCLWSSGCWTGLYFARAENQKEMRCPETMPLSPLLKVRGLTAEVVVLAPNSTALETVSISSALWPPATSPFGAHWLRMWTGLSSCSH